MNEMIHVSESSNKIITVFPHVRKLSKCAQKTKYDFNNRVIK